MPQNKGTCFIGLLSLKATPQRTLYFCGFRFVTLLSAHPLMRHREDQDAPLCLVSWPRMVPFPLETAAPLLWTQTAGISKLISFIWNLLLVLVSVMMAPMIMSQVCCCTLLGRTADTFNRWQQNFWGFIQFPTAMVFFVPWVCKERFLHFWWELWWALCTSSMLSPLYQCH